MVYMAESTHYDTLDISPSASQTEIKQAYRKLVKQFHPDSNRTLNNHDRIAGINAAYEILGDPQRRRSYDRELSYRGSYATASSSRSRNATDNRQERTTDAQDRHRRRASSRHTDEQLQQWLTRVYQPVTRLISQIINPLQFQIDQLAADPFDDELIDEFQAYLDDCRDTLQQAQLRFRSMPNPTNVAGVAAHLYYCLNQVGDGIDELERFICSYDDHYLHTGQELFRIAKGLRKEAQAAIRDVFS